MSENQQTLEGLLHNRVSEFANSDKPAEIIDKHMERLFDDIISSQFRSFGDFGKTIQEAVKNALPGNISEDFELTRYNNLIVNALVEKWTDSEMPKQLVDRATEVLETTIQEMQIPEQIKLSDLLESFVETHAEEALQEGWEQPHIVFEESSVVSGFFMIFFDKQPESGDTFRSSKYSLDNQLHVRLDEGQSLTDPEPVGRVFAATVDGDLMGREQGVWTSKYERLMVALYYGGARLVVDCDEDGFSYPYSD